MPFRRLGEPLFSMGFLERFGLGNKASGGGDAIAPSVTIALTSYTASTDTASMTITFSEEVTGFAVGDITISAGGNLASFATADNIVFTVDWTLAVGVNTMDIAAGVCEDLAGNDNTAAAQYGIGAEQTATIKPDSTTGKDVYIDQANPATNQSGSNYLYIGEWSAVVSLQRALIEFDETLIPANALVKTSTLKLYADQDNASNARSIRAYRLKIAWVLAQATWNIRSTGNNWQTAGAFGANDCEQTDIGSYQIPEPLVAGYYSIALTPSKVEEWIDGTFANNGLLLKMDTENADNHRHSASRDAAVRRPIWETVYRVPL